MFELKEGGVSDLLFLFEANQDTTVLDSAEDPIGIKVLPSPTNFNLLITIGNTDVAARAIDSVPSCGKS
jgi:hypothetical protein